MSYAELAAVWKDERAAYVGMADSGVVPVLGRILDDVKPRTLIVDRPQEDVFQSFLHFLPELVERAEKPVRAYIAQSSKTIDAYRSHPLVKVVDFDALNSRETVRDCLAWVMPGNPDPLKDELMHMNIQVDPDWALEEAHKPHTHWYANDSL